MDVLLMPLGSALLAVGAVVVAIVVHLIGLGRIAPTSARGSSVLGLPGRRLRADASVYRATHRAATPLVWLTCSIAAVAALGAVVAGASVAAEEWAILNVLAAIILVVGLVLATWRAHASLPG